MWMDYFPFLIYLRTEFPSDMSQVSFIPAVSALKLACLCDFILFADEPADLEHRKKKLMTNLWPLTWIL